MNCDTYSPECNRRIHQSCSGYDNDGDLCECDCHEVMLRDYLMDNRTERE